MEPVNPRVIAYIPKQEPIEGAVKSAGVLGWSANFQKQCARFFCNWTKGKTALFVLGLFIGLGELYALYGLGLSLYNSIVHKTAKLQDGLDKTVATLAKTTLPNEANEPADNLVLKNKVFGPLVDDARDASLGSFQKDIDALWDEWTGRLQGNAPQGQQENALMHKEALAEDLLNFPLDRFYSELYKKYQDSIRDQGLSGKVDKYKRMRLILELRDRVEKKFLSGIEPLLQQKIAFGSEEEQTKYIQWAGNQLSRLSATAGQKFFKALLEGAVQTPDPNQEGNTLFTLPPAYQIPGQNGYGDGWLQATGYTGCGGTFEGVKISFTEKEIRRRFSQRIKAFAALSFGTALDAEQAWTKEVKLDVQKGKIDARIAYNQALQLQAEDLDDAAEEMTEEQFNALAPNLQRAIKERSGEEEKAAVNARAAVVPAVDAHIADIQALLLFQNNSAAALQLLEENDQNPFTDYNTALEELLDQQRQDYAAFCEAHPLCLVAQAASNAAQQAIVQHLNGQNITNDPLQGAQCAAAVMAVLDSENGTIEAAIEPFVPEEHRAAIAAFVNDLEIATDKGNKHFSMIRAANTGRKERKEAFFAALRAQNAAFNQLRDLASRINQFDQFLLDLKDDNSDAAALRDAGFECKEAIDDYSEALDALRLKRKEALAAWKGALVQERNQLQETSNQLKEAADLTRGPQPINPDADAFQRAKDHFETMRTWFNRSADLIYREDLPGYNQAQDYEADPYYCRSVVKTRLDS